jgi:hypothetical protein
VITISSAIHVVIMMMIVLMLIAISTLPINV